MIITKLKIERIKKQLKQRELSKLLSISQCYLSQLETLKEKPSNDLKERIENYFNIPVDELLKKIDL